MSKIMKSLAASAAGLACSGAAYAGGIDRSPQSVNFLFEEGRYLEFQLNRINPVVSGSLVADPSVESGDIIGDENLLSLHYKQDLGDKWVLGLATIQPYGVRTNYQLNTGHPFQGSTADLNVRDVSAYLRYKVGGGFSAYGGLRLQRLDGKVTLPRLADYRMETNTDHELGYALGVAYEKPEIAMRVALTYNSAVDHKVDSTETSGFGTVNGQFETTFPESVNLEFQSGVAKDTLVFGSVRWVDWSEFTINPPFYESVVPNELAGYDSDTVTYKIGVGRRLTDQWSVALTLTHEPGTGDLFGNLGPVDGRTGIGVGATYTMDNMKISAGVEYNWLGDALSQDPLAAAGTPISDFRNNYAINAGLRVGFYF